MNKIKCIASNSKMRVRRTPLKKKIVVTFKKNPLNDFYPELMIVASQDTVPTCKF